MYKLNISVVAQMSIIPRQIVGSLFFASFSTNVDPAAVTHQIKQRPDETINPYLDFSFCKQPLSWGKFGLTLMYLSDAIINDMNPD